MSFIFLNAFVYSSNVIYNIAATGAEKKLFGFSFLPLEDDFGLTVLDGKHELVVFKVS